MTSPGVTEPDAAPGPLLTSGMTADVYLIDERRILRRYRQQHDLSREVEIMRHLRSHGFAVPEVYAAEGLDLVMERLQGPTMLQALAAGEISLPDGGQLLADLHRQLHSVPPPHRDGEGIVHLELQPGNVILSEKYGPVIIHWANARTGPADLDIAVSAVIIAEVAVDEDDPEYSRAARAFLAAFLAAAHGDPLPHLDAAVRIRLGDPSLVPGERALVPPAADLVRQFASV